MRRDASSLDAARPQENRPRILAGPSIHVAVPTSLQLTRMFQPVACPRLRRFASAGPCAEGLSTSALDGRRGAYTLTLSTANRAFCVALVDAQRLALSCLRRQHNARYAWCPWSRAQRQKKAVGGKQLLSSWQIVQRSIRAHSQPRSGVVPEREGSPESRGGLHLV